MEQDWILWYAHHSSKCCENFSKFSNLSQINSNRISIWWFLIFTHLHSYSRLHFPPLNPNPNKSETIWFGCEKRKKKFLISILRMRSCLKLIPFISLIFCFRFRLRFQREKKMEMETILPALLSAKKFSFLELCIQAIQTRRYIVWNLLYFVRETIQ